MSDATSETPPVVTTPTELFNSKTLFTLGGSSAGVWLFTVVISHAFGIDWNNYRWIGLVIALLLAFVGAFASAKFSIKLTTVSLFNGLLIYVTSVGINAIEQGDNANDAKQGALVGWTSNKPWWPARVLTDSIENFQSTVVRLAIERDSILHITRLVYDSFRVYRDSVSLTQPKRKVTDHRVDLSRCMEQNRNLQHSLDACNVSLANAGGTHALENAERREAINLLSQCVTANDNLLESLVKFQQAGGDPRAQQQTLPLLYERANALGSELKDYDKQIQQLIAKLKK